MTPRKQMSLRRCIRGLWGTLRPVSIALFAFLLLSPHVDAQAEIRPTVTVVAASDTYPAGTDNDGFVSMTDDPLGPFSGQSVTFRGLVEGGVQQVYRYRLDFDQVVTLDSINIEGAGWSNGSISLLDEQGIVITTISDTSSGGCCRLHSWELGASEVTGRTFFLEEFNEDGAYRYRSNIEVKLAANSPTVSVVAASGTYPAGTPQNGDSEPGGTIVYTSMTDDPLGPFVGESVHFLGNGVGGVQQVYRYRLDYDRGVTLDSIVVEGVAWNNSIISLLDEQSNVLVTKDVAGDNRFESHVLDASGITGRTFFLEELNGDSNWRYRSNIEINLANEMPSNSIDINVRAFIDGKSQIKIQDNQLWWHHIEAAAPGVYEGANEPTTINGIDWFPVWPFNDEGRECDCESDKFDLASAGIQLSNDLELLELRVVNARDSASIIQPPSAGNGFLTIIELDDPSGGPEWYEVIAVFFSDGDPPVNNTPMAVNDAVDADTGVSVVIDVLDNDQSLADTPIVVSISADPANGSAIAGADNNVTYTSNPGFVGDDSFQYTATDRDGDAASGTVTVTVVDPNAGGTGVIPAANNDSAEATSGGNVIIDVLANDQRLDDGPVVVSIDIGPSGGTAFVMADNRISYTADNGFEGNDEVRYTVTDRDGDTATATVTVIVSIPEVVVTKPRKVGGGAVDLYMLTWLLLASVIAALRSR